MLKLIVGLGNPGIFYRTTRHNVGFRVVDALAKAYKIPLRSDRSSRSLSGKGNIQGAPVVIAMPLTYMNLSGQAVAALVKKHKIGPERMLVVYDDIDLDFGRIKVRESGSSGGHRGMKSIIEALGSQEFNRLRVGIGRPAGDKDAADYVLAGFNSGEKTRLKGIIKEACACLSLWASEGITECMNVFNRRSN